jgi:hypothetical protein
MRPDLPTPAAELLEIGRRYFDVEIAWVEPGAQGRTFGFWRVEAGPPGWRGQPRAEVPIWQHPPESPGSAPVVCEWRDPWETLRRALGSARARWPGCVVAGPGRGP